MKIILRLYFLAVFLNLFLSSAKADIIKLKSGRSVEGIINSEDEQFVGLEIDAGVVKFAKSQILDILRSSAAERNSLRENWQRKKADFNKKLVNKKNEEEGRPKELGFSYDAKGIIVRVILNNKVETTMVLDTGASLILLTRGVAKNLGINLDRLKPDTRIRVADGRTVEASRIVLNNVRVEGCEANNVDAVVLMADRGDFGFRDGLLGMSFLKNFNFKIDHKEKKLILEKIK
ncbi:MAG: retropepsin-like aspartic protease [Candidatus Omnitrophica bacterium]|jgi:clan AA aspartic protease (TIGR02281 family)|nr:retropepsin-like aspartic protease [Candidatus Omnitrophota bacterium]MDD4981728.1 retropepsin-like aspartic protease [Candidatus Omnitrophota bacterium]MDD5664651.1 retropepsin-like aspartic protease [Candidatus Omnitrophota bacterium]